MIFFSKLLLLHPPELSTPFICTFFRFKQSQVTCRAKGETKAGRNGTGLTGRLIYGSFLSSFTPELHQPFLHLSQETEIQSHSISSAHFTPSSKVSLFTGGGCRETDTQTERWTDRWPQMWDDLIRWVRDSYLTVFNNAGAASNEPYLYKITDRFFLLTSVFKKINQYV